MSTAVNGRPSWISSRNAIWSNPDISTYWVIGKLEDVGTDSGYIYANGMFFGPNKTDNWRFSNGSELKTLDKNDVIVECTFENGESHGVYIL